MNHLLASLGISQDYAICNDTIVFMDADGATWNRFSNPENFYPRSCPLGTTPVALASGELIGWGCLKVSKDHQYLTVIPMLKLVETSIVVRLEIRRDRAGNPTLIAPSRAAVTDARDIVLFRDPPALKTSATLYGDALWLELGTEEFFIDDHGRNQYVPKHYVLSYLGANYGQHRNAPAPLHGGAAQGTSGSARAYYDAARPPAKPTTTLTVQSAAARAGADLKPWTVHLLPQPKLPRADPVVGELVAWRAWGLARGFDNLLTSIYRTAVGWKPRETLVSQPPTDYGDIGIHAHKTRETLLKYVGEQYSTKLLVIGRVRLWGEVVEGETGYRAEFAQVESLEEILRPKFAGWSEVDWDGSPRHMSPAEEDVNNKQLLAKLREVYGVN